MSAILSSFRRASNPSSDEVNAASEHLKGPTNSKILVEPAPGCKPLERKPYTPDQQDKIAQLSKYAHSILLPESDPYHPWELRFISDPGFAPRYARASKFNLENGKERIKGTMEWRREYKPDLIKEEDVRIESETGKIILNGFDRDARPVIYMRPGRENTEQSPRQILHLIFVLERAIDLMPPGQETLAIIVDYASATSQTNPSVGTARKVLNILQNHYVERMGRAIVVRMPWWINAFFTAISPFMDPVTRDKIRFNPKLVDLIPEAHLDAEFGGGNNYKFDPKIYWETIVSFCHLAPNGCRLDKEGAEVVPPLGHGAKVAYEDTTLSNPTSSSNGKAGATDAKGNDQHATSPSVAKLPNSEPSDEARARSSMEGMEGRAHLAQPGPPVSDVVFDHPPTEDEKHEALLLVQSRKSLDK